MLRFWLSVYGVAASVGCSDPFTFTLNVAGVTDEIVTVDGAAQTASGGKVVVVREFDSYDDARSNPTAIALVVERNGQNVLTWVFEPGLSCESKADPWLSETVELTLPPTMSLTCTCEADGARLFGTCPPSQ